MYFLQGLLVGLATFAPVGMQNLFIINTAYERILNGAKATTIKANVVGGSEFDILVPEREKGRATTGIEYKLENKFGLLFNLKVDYGFRHGSNKKSTRFSTGLGYKF